MIRAERRVDSGSVPPHLYRHHGSGIRVVKYLGDDDRTVGGVLGLADRRISLVQVCVERLGTTRVDLCLAKKTLAMIAVRVGSPFFDLIPRQLPLHLHHAVAFFCRGNGLFLDCAGLAETDR